MKLLTYRIHGIKLIITHAIIESKLFYLKTNFIPGSSKGNIQDNLAPIFLAVHNGFVCRPTLKNTQFGELQTLLTDKDLV